MLRPQTRKHPTHSGNTRSPLIGPTDDDHPLLPNVLDIQQDQHLRPSLISAASQLDLLSARTASISVSPRLSRDDTRNRGVAGDKEACDTEVYVHEVTKTDTLPRIILQYQIPVQVLRRANKLWANDSIQYKNILLLPVEACGIRPNLIEDFPSALVTPTESTTSTSISIMGKSSLPVESESDTFRSPSPLVRTKPERVKSSSKLHITRQVFVHGIGLVDVALVPSATLSYFPPSKNPSSRPSVEISAYRDSFESLRNDKRGSSFEILRASAGQFAADAYNGTQGLIRRLKDKKHVNEIDLIDL